MKKAILTFVMSLSIVTMAYAVDYTITLTAEQDKAMGVLSVTAQAWIQHAAENKANKMINRLVDPLSDKKISKMTAAEKKVILDGIDIAAERIKRHGR